MVASTSLYHDWITLNGGWRLSFNFGWGPVRQESRIMQNPGPHTIDGLRAIHYDQVQRHLPLNTMQQLVGRNARFYDDWLAHPDYDAYWKPLNVEELFDKIAIPVHTFGGWFDIFSQGTLRGYVGMSQKGATERARRMSHLVIGPWGHGPSQKFGALDFGPDGQCRRPVAPAALVRLLAQGHRQRARRAKPPVKLFVMGRNEWVYEREYPLARTRVPAALLRERRQGATRPRGDGRLTWDEAGRRVASRSVPLRSRRSRPVPGRQQLLRHADAGGPAGPAPDRGPSRRPVYTSDVLQEELEATGPVKVVLYAASDAVDTDFVAKLVDVYPDGSSYNMAEGILRARYRDSLTPADTPHAGPGLSPGDRSGGHLGRVSAKGHRIRVHVTSSHFPQFDRNPNTGAVFGTTSEVKVAQQTIYHDAERPSHVLLPVIPPR